MSKPWQFNLPQSFDFDLDDGRVLDVTITHEGIIMDVYDKVETDEDDTVLDDVHSGTAGMMFDEWADEVINFDSPTKY